MKGRLLRLAPAAIVYLATILIRVDLIRAAGLTLGDAVSPGVLLGFLYDLGVLIALTGLVASIAAMIGRYQKKLLSVIWFAFLAALSANLVYFRFFGTELSLWVVRLHWRDTAVVAGSAAELGFSFSIVGAAIFYAGAIYLLRRHDTSSGRRRFESAALSLFAAVCGAMLLPLPVWMNWIGFEREQRFGEAKVVGENIIRTWIDTFIEGEKGLQAKGLADHRRMAKRGHSPESVLARYRGAPAEVSMRRTFAPAESETKEFRRELGLPEAGPVNVIVVFLESVRGYEFFEPRLSRAVFPGIWSIAERQGIVFTQAYSSSAEAGQTVRGQFSTLCSALPNFKAPAAFLAANQVSTVCLAQVFASLGHQALWINAYDRVFHGTEAFERLHGTREFFDIADFLKAGIGIAPGRLGVEDDDFLREALHLIRERAASGPVFANLATISTHHPHPVNPRHRLTRGKLGRTGGEMHWRYLTQLNALDQALSEFLSGLFGDPVLGSRTIVAVVADHSIGLDTRLPEGRVAREDARFRIPFLLFTKKMKHPRIIRHPMHQIDIAPTLATIAGWKGETTWLGRNVLRGPGSPWVFLEKNGVSYRTADRLCQTSTEGTHCYETAGGLDPLFDSLPHADRRPEEEEFFSDVAASARLSVLLNLYKNR